jgi:hypothetical protein
MSTAPFGTDPRPAHADRLPTLTEVLELGRGDGDVADAGPPAALDEAPEWAEPGPALRTPQAGVEPADPGLPQDRAPAAALPDAQALVALVLAELAPRLEVLFEARMREAVAPALARAADLLIREIRPELAATLHDLVAEAVARTLDRHSSP